uniref:Uncharacterized protein n=1 Tax=Avena sativa TaxID=4498 RepID=A0ACD5U3N8_AVESA
MASRRFLDYDPFGYYYPSPSYYHNSAAFQEPAVRHRSPHVYYRQRPDHSARSPARNGGGFFWDAESPEPVMREVLRPRPRSSRSVSSVPVQFVGYDFEPERKTVAVPKKRVPSPEEAAVTVQAAARGFVARRMVRAVREVEREAEVVATRLAAEAEALRVDSRGRIAIGEELMRLLFRLDAVRGVREYRKKVTKKVLALQDAVDALEAKPAQAAPAAAKAETVEMSAVESGMMVPELPQSREQGVQIGSNVAPDSSAVETTSAEMDMEVDGGRAVEADSAATETVAAESRIVGEEATEEEAEWEMVTGDDALCGENPQPKAQQQETATEKKTEAASADGLDAKKVMEMVAALCERSAQQCELIGALAERVDTLERAVRRVDEADRRRQRIKKIKKEGKINGKAAKNFYSDL